MLETVINYINTQIETLNTFSELRGLCEKIKEKNGDEAKEFPAEYCGNDEWKNINLEKEVLYHRLSGTINVSQGTSDTTGCDTLITKTYPLRLIACAKKSRLGDNAYTDLEFVENIESKMSSLNATITGLDADLISIKVTSIEMNNQNILSDEFTNVDLSDVGYKYSYFQINYEITISANKSCFELYGCPQKTFIYFKTADYAEVANNSLLQFTDGFTLEAFVKPISFAGSYGAIMEKLADNYGLYRKGEFGFSTYFNTTSGSEETMFQDETLKKIFYHVVATYDKNAVLPTSKIYFNTILKSTGVKTDPLITSNDNLVIGGNAGDDAFIGGIKMLRIYNRAITAAEVSSNYNNGSGRRIPINTSGLILNIPFDGNARDISGNGLDATLFGTPKYF